MLRSPPATLHSSPRRPPRAPALPVQRAPELPAPRLNWLTRASTTYFPDPLAKLVLEYLPPHHGLHARYDAYTHRTYREQIDRKDLRDPRQFKPTRHRDLIDDHAPGTLMAVIKPGARYGYWATLMSTWVGDGAYQVVVDLAGYPPRSDDVPGDGLHSPRAHLIGDLYRFRLDAKAQCFLPVTQDPGSGALHEGDLRALARGSRLIVYGRPPGWYSGHSAEGAVLLAVHGTRLFYKQPRAPEPGRLPRVTKHTEPEPDAPTRQEWVVQECDTRGATRVVPHPFYRKDASEGADLG